MPILFHIMMRELLSIKPNTYDYTAAVAQSASREFWLVHQASDILKCLKLIQSKLRGMPRILIPRVATRINHHSGFLRIYFLSYLINI